MTVAVRAYGPLIDVLGAATTTLTLDLPRRVSELRPALDGAFPALRGHHFRIAVDHRLLSEGSVVDAVAELALLPPASGG